jgi:hypothetical protein
MEEEAMKFLIFNILVVAALGYLLYERGMLEGSTAGEAAERAVSTMEQKVKPIIEELSKPTKQEEARHTNERKDEEGYVAAQINTDTAAVPPRQMVPPEQSLGGPPKQTEIEPSPVTTKQTEIEPSPVTTKQTAAINGPVPPEVAARRKVVLDLKSKPKVSTVKSTADNTERRKRLQALAEEAEMLSIELIYR